MKEIRSIVRGSFWKQLGTLSGGNLLTLLITIVSYPILSRLYTDVEFGTFTVFQSVLLILIPLSTFNYHEAMVLTKSADERSALIKLLMAILGIVLVAVIFCISLNGFDFIGLTVNLVWLIPVSLILGSALLSLTQLLLQKEDLKALSVIKTIDRVGFNGIAIILATIKTTFNGLIAGMLAGQFIAVAIASVRSEISLQKRSKPQEIIATAKKYSDFVKFSLIGGFMERAGRHLPILIFTWLASDSLAGQYAMSYKILTIPEIIIGMSVGQLFYVRAAKRFNNKQNLSSLLIKTWIFLLGVVAVPILIICFFSPQIFSTILGSQWAQAGEIAVVLLPLVVMLFITAPTSYLVNVFNKQHLDLVLGTITLLTRATTLYVGLSYLAVEQAILLFSATEALILIGFNIYLYIITRRWDALHAIS